MFWSSPRYTYAKEAEDDPASPGQRRWSPTTYRLPIKVPVDTLSNNETDNSASQHRHTKASHSITRAVLPRRKIHTYVHDLTEALTSFRCCIPNATSSFPKQSHILHQPLTSIEDSSLI